MDISHFDWERREWVREAVQRINADFNRSADTHLIKVDLPGFDAQTLYLKDESTHPTGSLKHRLARSLYLYGLCNGWIGPDTVIVESSSGSTAVSEAYFARLLGLRFIAVVQEGVSRSKIDQIAFYGGETRAVPPADIYAEAERIAAELGGHYMDQFTYAERVTDWRGNNNIAESLFSQLSMEAHALPDWVVMSAGTGAPPPRSGATFATVVISQRRPLSVSPILRILFFTIISKRAIRISVARANRVLRGSVARAWRHPSAPA